MSIEAYGRIMCIFYIGLFLVSVLVGIIAVGYTILRKKPLKYGWIIPCITVYSIFALCNTFVPSIAYDDVSHPNYSNYENWQHFNFILNDIKMLLIWLIIGILIYFVFRRKKVETSQKTGGRALFFIGTALFVLMIFLLVYTN